MMEEPKIKRGFGNRATTGPGCKAKKKGVRRFAEPNWVQQDQLDLEEFRCFFEKLSDGESFSASVFLFSMLFSVIHAWKPPECFFTACPQKTSPARALCWHHQLWLSDEDKRRLRHGRLGASVAAFLLASECRSGLRMTRALARGRRGQIRSIDDQEGVKAEAVQPLPLRRRFLQLSCK